MRLAFVDLVFSWPPHGGADVDLYQTICGLQNLGHETRLFVCKNEASWERGSLNPAGLPFPAEFVDFSLNSADLGQRFRSAIDGWKPDAVFVCDGFFMKPVVALALKDYPTVGRFYAYEAACMRDMLLFKDGAPCPKNYLETPNFCRTCAVAGMKPALLKGKHLAWTEEFLAARAYLPGYHGQLVKAIESFNAVIVYNELMKRQLAAHNGAIHVVPGGVKVDDYPNVEPISKEKTRILMTGRVEDPMKGLATLREAGESLARTRNDFEIWATHTDYTLNSAWFQAIGWRDHATIKTLYQEADICVAPSIWEEPFGLVAVEAMASGRPVCASRVGGLQHIVTHGETGLLFDRQDSAGLASCLARLLDDKDQRLAMGRAARIRAEEFYDWKQIIAGHYPAILDAVSS